MCNIFCHPERFTTDSVYSDISVINDKLYITQFFINVKSLISNIYSIKTKKTIFFKILFSYGEYL